MAFEIVKNNETYDILNTLYEANKLKRELDKNIINEPCVIYKVKVFGEIEYLLNGKLNLNTTYLRLYKIE